MADASINQPEIDTSQPSEDSDIIKESERIQATDEEDLAPKKETVPSSPKADPADEKFRPGTTKNRPANWLLTLILLIVIGALVAALVGAWHRGELWKVFRRVSLRPAPQMALLESRDEKSLLLQTDGERRQVLVQLPDRDGWVVVSRDDFTAANPALSPDGAWVAYLSTQGAPKIVVVPLEQAGRASYTSEDLRRDDQENKTPMTDICPWSPVAWSMDSQRLAFFGCLDDPPMSRVFVADLINTTTPSLRVHRIDDIMAPGLEPRQISWIGSDKVLVTFPPTADTETETAQTIPVPTPDK